MCTKLNLSLLLVWKFCSLYIKLQLHFANKGIDYYISDEINPEQHADMMSNVIYLQLLSSIFPAYCIYTEERLKRTVIIRIC